MKKRKIVYLFPLAALLLSGCTFAEFKHSVGESWIGQHVLHPIKDLFDGNKENQGGDHGDDQVVAKEIKQLIGVPEKIEQDAKLEASSLSAKVLYSDGSEKTEPVTKVELDTSKVGEAQGKAYVNALFKEFTITVEEKEVPPVPVEIDHIEIAGSMTKTSYKVGEAFSSEGLSVKAVKKDKTESIVSGSFEFTPAKAEKGTSSVSVVAKYSDNFESEPKIFTVSVEEEQTKNYGSENAPLTVSQALALITEECTEDKAMTAQAITVQGQITEIKNTFTYESGPCFEFNISDGTSTVYVYRCHCTEEQKANVVVGATVKLVGYAKNFKGTLEFVDNGASQCHILSIEGDTPDKELVSISIEGSLTKTEYVEGQTYSSAGLSVKGHYDDGSEGVVAATITLNKTTAALGDTEIIASATYNGKTAEPKAFTISVVEGQVKNYGTEQAPLTVSQALALITEECTEDKAMTAQAITVQGQITEIKNTFTYESGPCFEFNISDGTSTVYVYRCHCTEEQKANVVVGATVKLVGYAKNFKGTLEFVDNGASQCHILSIEGDTPDKELVSISIEGSLTKTEYVEGQTYSSAGLSVKGHYDDGSEGVVAATITLNKATAALGDTEIIASATFKEITAEPKTFAVTVSEKVPVVGGSVYTFKNDKTQAQNVGTWTSEEFMKHVEVDGGEIITGMKDATNAYIGGNGGSGDAQWNIWNCLKVGKSSAKGSISLTLDPTATFSKIKMDVIGARDDGTLTINEITQNVTKKAIKDDLEPIELEYEIAGGITELKLSSKDATSNNYGIVITRIEFVDEGPKVPVLSSLELTKSPDKVDYHAGEEFDPTGMVITAKYTNGGQDKVLAAEEYSVDKTVLSLNDEFVTVSYEEGEIEKTVQVPVSVTKAPVPVTGISLNLSEVTIKVNEQDVTLTATVIPADADDPSVVWSVSKEGVVTVNNGVVHAVAAGEVTVTATAGDFHADCVVTVAPADKILSGIEVTTQPSKRSYVAGEIFDPTGMVVTASYSSGHNSEEVTGYTYSTAALEETDTTVEIDYNGKKAYVEISVSPAPALDSITVANAQGKTAEYAVGDVISKDDIVVTAHYTQGKPDAVVTNYTISKTTALALGDTSVTITYVEGGIEKTATYSFTVTKLTEPQIDVSNVDLYSIDAASLGLGSYADGTNTDLAWTMLCKGSSDTLQGNSSKSSELHNKIAFSKNITYIKFNVGYAAGAAATGSVRFGSSVTPTGNDTSYGANTDLSLVTVGSFNVSAPVGCNYFSVVWTKGASYFSSIEIHFEEMGEQEQVAVQSVSLNKTSTSINVGSNETLVATVAPSNANDKSVTWSSSNSTIATVDNTGKVTGIAQGTATITVTTTDGEKTATCSVTVVPAGSTTSSPIDLGGSATVVFNGTSYSNSIKAGTGSAAGSTTISVPSGANKLTFYAAGWNKENVTISVSGGGISKSLSLTSDAGVSGNGPTYTLGSTNDASFKFEIDVSSLSGATTLTISATSGKRFVLWNASYTK